MTNQAASATVETQDGTAVAPKTNSGARGSSTPEDIGKRMVARLDDRIQAQVRAGIKDTEDAVAALKEGQDQIRALLEDRNKEERVGYVAGSGEGTGDEEFSMYRVLESLVTGDKSRAEMEWEQSRQAADELRAQGTMTDVLGGFVVPGQVMDNLFVPLLRPRIIAYQLGAMDLPATGIPVEVPIEVKGPEVEAVAENKAHATDSEPEWGILRVFPHTAQSFLKASDRFLSMGKGAESFLRKRMAQEIAITTDRWALRGTGADNEPRGLINTAGIGSVDFSTLSAPTDYELYEKTLHLENKLAEAEVLGDAGALRFAMANKAMLAMRLVKSENASAGTDSGEMDRKMFSDGKDSRVIGYEYQISNQLRTGAVTDLILGDWSELMIARWGNIILRASNVSEDAMKKRQTHLVAYHDVGVGVLRP